ncbi:MAG: hypothetical protein HYT77_02670 [Deltaproteobacteria bacterium]|nr:hypothetical protein [Deltaproteobacteria bacterium]
MSRLKRKGARVIIAIPVASSYIYWRTVAGFLELERPAQTEIMFFQGALVDRARNYLVQQMLDHPMRATHLFFLDSDIVLPSDALMRLLAHKKPIISGLYRKRLPPFEPMAFTEGRGTFEPISLKKPTRRLLSVDYVGGGCLLIERNVFKKLRPPWFVSTLGAKRHLPEDFYFCEKARRVGLKVFVDPSVTPLHLEPMGVTTDLDGTPEVQSLI